MATLRVDDVDYEIHEGENLLHACLSLGLDLPYFCWHPALGSVGACRQCAVKQFKDEHDTRGRIVMACLTPARDGARIAIADPEAHAFRAQVIEWLMLNHPHDCPVCDEGGECHLQDMTVMTGHVRRRSRFPKRTFRNQELGPFLDHEMNRCIECYRCVRFYRDYAGGRDFQVMASKNHVYFGRHEDGVLENIFSGNLAEVCPTGVFTDKSLGRHYTRKWDLRCAPSLCVHCALGCNVSPAERYGVLRRIQNRYNGAVNGYFLCDRGRYGYGFVNSPRRIRTPRLRGEPCDPPAAIAHAAVLFDSTQRVIGIGSPRASLEANFALRKLVGAANFHCGFSAPEQRLIDTIVAILRSDLRCASLRDAEQADAVLVLGEDLAGSAPRLALTLRQAVRNGQKAQAAKLGIEPWLDGAVRDAVIDGGSPLFIAAPFATALDDVATQVWRAAPDAIVRLAGAVARNLGADLPAPVALSDEAAALADQIAAAFGAARRPLVIAGVAGGSDALLQIAAQVARARGCEIHLTLPECDSLGLALLGGAPLEAALAAADAGQLGGAIILENDLYRRGEAARIDRFFAQAGRVVVLDHLENATTARAEVVLPAATFAEASGTLVSSEGRAQRFFRVLAPPAPITDSWRWLVELAHAAGCGEELPFTALDGLMRACAAAVPELAPIPRAAPDGSFRIEGDRIAREPHRYSGRTAMAADRTMFEPRPPADRDSPLSFSMEGYYGSMPGALYPFFWAPGWNSIQALNKFQEEVAGPLRGGDGGIRLLEPRGGAPAESFEEPPPFAARSGELLVVALPVVFGSDELSMASEPIAARAETPHLALHPEDARELRIEAGLLARLFIGDVRAELPVRLRPDLARGVAAVPAGLPDLPWLPLPGSGRIEPAVER